FSDPMRYFGWKLNTQSFVDKKHQAGVILRKVDQSQLEKLVVNFYHEFVECKKNPNHTPKMTVLQLNNDKLELKCTECGVVSTFLANEDYFVNFIIKQLSEPKQPLKTKEDKSDPKLYKAAG